jgi:hypothetical protein
VRLALNQAMGLELVDNKSRVGGVDAIGLGEIGEGHRSVAELKKDLAPPGAEAKPERLSEIDVTVVRVNELLHEDPDLLCWKS